MTEKNNANNLKRKSSLNFIVKKSSNKFSSNNLKKQEFYKSNK